MPSNAWKWAPICNWAWPQLAVQKWQQKRQNLVESKKQLGTNLKITHSTQNTQTDEYSNATNACIACAHSGVSKACIDSEIRIALLCRWREDTSRGLGTGLLPTCVYAMHCTHTKTYSQPLPPDIRHLQMRKEFEKKMRARNWLKRKSKYCNDRKYTFAVKAQNSPCVCYVQVYNEIFAKRLDVKCRIVANQRFKMLLSVLFEQIRFRD